MERWVQRALLHLQGLARDLLDALGDRVAVNWTQGDDFEDQENTALNHLP